MDLKRLRELQEEYIKVVENQQLDEVLDTQQKTQSYAAKNAASAVGAFVRGDKKTLSKRFEGAKRGMKKIEKRKEQNEELNIYDILISHLLDEGYAEDVRNAYQILENMSEEWVLEILDEAKWIQKAIKHPGAFSKKAKKHDMSPQQFAGYVSSHPEKFGNRTERQANLAKTLKKISKD